MWLGRVSNPGPLTYESGALTTALRGPAALFVCSPPIGARKTIVLPRDFNKSPGLLP